MRAQPVACFLFSLLLCACAAKKVELTKSGFLNNYDQLQQDERVEGMMIYRNEAVDIAGRYAKVMIAPVVIQLDPGQKDAKLSEEDKQKLGDYFHEQLAAKLGNDYEITEERGEDVMLLRAAITDILANKVYLNLHWSTTLVGAGIGGASIEAELVDSMTGERILAFIDAMKGRRLDITEPSKLFPTYTDGLTKWGHTKYALETWAEILVKNLEELKAH
jgi:hypothetical protein